MLEINQYIKNKIYIKVLENEYSEEKNYKRIFIF